MGTNESTDLASKIMADIRANREIEDSQARLANSFPHIDSIRHQVRSNDLPTILALTDHNQEGVRGLAFSLLKSMDNDPEIMSYLQTLWRRRTDFNTRQNIMWRILDFADLSPEFHRQIFRFVKKNWSEFIEIQTRFMGGGKGPVHVMPAVESRLANPGFPESKHWAYLCASFACQDPAQIQELLTRYKNSEASIVGEVVVELFEKTENN